MTSRALAWRTVAAEPARAALAVVGVAVIGALLFDMLMLSQGLLVSFRQMLDTSGYDVRVLATDALPARIAIANATEVAADIAGLPEVSDVAMVRSDRAMVLVPNRSATEVTLLNVTAVSRAADAPASSARTRDAEREGWRIVEGVDLGSRGPTASPFPAVVSRALGRALSLAPGSALPLRVVVSGATSVVPLITFTVVGVADFQLDGGGAYAVATTLEAFQHARASLSSESADVILVASRPPADAARAVAAIADRQHAVHAFSNEQIVERFNENGFAYFRQISFVLSTITLAFAFLLVATLLTVSANQRLGQVAALRALGVPRRRIAATLIWESALLVGAGGFLSLPIGWVLALQLDRILRAMPNIPERMHFFVLEPRLALWHLGLLAATGLAAVVYPVWVAARLPIAATLRFETVS
jgi:putative ABC transport system permease protein